MSALAINPSDVVDAEQRRYCREGARLHAMVLLADPERIADRDVGSFLLEIPHLDRDVAIEWLSRVGVNPWRPSSKLTRRERHMLAGLLVTFSKQTDSAAGFLLDRRAA